MINKIKKKGLSVVIGYVLLMAISIFMSIMVYRWIKTYVPKDITSCPEGTSISIKQINYSCGEQDILNVTLKNNGRFSLDGYYIRASNQTSNNLANIDISPNLTGIEESERSQILWGNEIKFQPLPENAFSPGAGSRVYSFNVTDYNTLSFIEIIPIRRMVIENKKRVAICSNAIIKEQVSCL